MPARIPLPPPPVHILKPQEVRSCGQKRMINNAKGAPQQVDERMAHDDQWFL